MSSPVEPTAPATRPAPRGYVPAVSPRLKVLLYVVFGLTALLGANSAYLVAIKFLQAIKAEQGVTYENYFFQWMNLVHLVLGLLLILPLVVFGFAHMFTARHRRNRRAVRMGYALFAVSLVVLITGVLLMRVGGFHLRQEAARTTIYWLHFAAPLVAGWLYWLHRLVGPRIKWRLGMAYAGVVAAGVVAMAAMHTMDPREWGKKAPAEGDKYFEPSLARTAKGSFIKSDVLMMNEYCLKCHADVYNGWVHSVHRFSSFNNPAYLASVRETREVALKRDGNVKASRWCAGCHDPVPFFSGAFDDPNYDVVNDPTAHAGITCTVCHSITHVNSTKGNADYVIEEPEHYPFATSDNAFLQYVNEQLVKSKPAMHKRTFLKPFHKTAEFCSTCHKVHLPKELNHYKEFLRGQNHYDPFLLSGVSGHGARSFYYPPKATSNCAGCHMPLQVSEDFGARFNDPSGKLTVHNHLFPAANTAVAHLIGQPGHEDVIKAHQEFLKTSARIDIFGLKEGGAIDGRLLAPLRPVMPVLKPGQNYLIETVIRTMKMGHLFTQGTADSNEVWVDVTVKSGDRVIGRSGAIDEQNAVDPWSHFLNVFLLDREGNRINRRNPQDIFTPLYNHQIPPGAAQVVHYGFTLPENAREPVSIDVALKYRKFDQEYMDFVTRKASKKGDKSFTGYEPGSGKAYTDKLPITILAADSITLAVEGGPAVAAPKLEDIARPIEPNRPLEAGQLADRPLWQRWNDYGIGLLLEGVKGELRQSIEAFAEVEKLGRYDGALNTVRVLFLEGRLDEAVEFARRAGEYKNPPAPSWTLAWLTGLINRQQGNLVAAQKDFENVLSTKVPERGFDFSRDYEVINELGITLFERAKRERSATRAAQRRTLLELAAEQFQKTLSLDSENVSAHYNLQLIYEQLGNSAKAAEHARLHRRYKADDNAPQAVARARQKYPAANHAAEAIVIYSLQRTGAPGLPERAATAPTSPGRPVRE